MLSVYIVVGNLESIIVIYISGCVCGCYTCCCTRVCTTRYVYVKKENIYLSVSIHYGYIKLVKVGKPLFNVAKSVNMVKPIFYMTVSLLLIN